MGVLPGPATRAPHQRNYRAVVEAAVGYQPAKAGGIDKALLTLRSQPFGEFLLIFAALGLAIFGVYSLCEARWRRV
jgi:hypothetical protein